MPERLPEQEILEKVLDVLDRLRLPYMIVGSMAVNFYGQPRYTHDLDLVVELAAGHVPALVAAFGPDYYLSEEGIRRALLTGTSFNLIHPASGFKVDFWLKKAGAFDQLQFDRRRPAAFLGRQAQLASPEDLVLTKLDWFRRFESEKHWKDAETVYWAQRSRLDASYLDAWAPKLGVQAEWERLKELPGRKSGASGGQP